MCSDRFGAFCLLAGLLAVSCSRPAPRQVERVAVLSFENLTSDPSLDWISRAAPAILAAEIEGAPSVHPLSVTDLGEARALRATRVLHGYFTRYAGRLRLHAFLQDLQRSKITRTLRAEGPAADGVLPLADSLARRLTPQVRPFPSANPSAIRRYADALRAARPAESLAALRLALEADPDFGEAHVALVRLLLAQGDRDAAAEALRSALHPARRMDGLSAARLEWLSASMTDDAGARRGAALKLARLSPADADLAFSAAEACLQQRDLSQALDWYRRAVRADPANGLLWNSLGYAQALGRDFEGARQSLRRYEELEPHNPNPLDSLGDVHFHLGRFADAAPFYLRAHEKSPSFLGGATLWKAGLARLMAGDLQGARELFSRYVDARRAAGDPLAGYYAAQSERLAGRRRQAIAFLTEFTLLPSNPPDVAASASIELAAWLLETGQWEAAHQAALRAASVAVSPPARLLASLGRFITEPPAAASEWTLRAARAFPDPSQESLRKSALAYALLFSRHFNEALPLLRELHHQAHPLAAGDLEVLLAWTLIETGDWNQARRLLDAFPIPQPAREGPFHSLVFPRLLFLRGLLFHNEGKADEARTSFALFLECAGDVPAVFGEENRAREALGR